MQITINRDATFMIGNELGDVPDGAELGLYHQDTRFLSRYELLLDGQPALLLASRATDYYTAMHFLTNPVLPEVPRGMLSITRVRTIDRGMIEEIEVTNHANTSAHLTLDLALDADFAHVFEVKSGIEQQQRQLRRKGTFTRSLGADGRGITYRNMRGPVLRESSIRLSLAPDLLGESDERGESGDRCRYTLHLRPGQRWHLRVECAVWSQVPASDLTTPAGEPTSVPATSAVPTSAPSLLRQVPTPLAADLAAPPILSTPAHILREGYEQSVRDYTALRLASESSEPDEFVIGAGIPWFMTLFGRDSLIASYQALPLFPGIAKGVLRALSRLQGTQVDRQRGEEPGKIVHENRFGAGSGAMRILSMFPYYGTIDATPLYLILLAAVYRVTGDRQFLASLRPNAEGALAWMDEYGDRDGDGYIEYLRASESGLQNQGWKDSFDAIRFRDGRLAQGPIALCEAQGYAYAARLGMAEVYAALGERELSAQQHARAHLLRRRFNADFWMPERGSYALALDGDKRQVDALTSNPGHLLWTGIADPTCAEKLAAHLAGPGLFSGWGVRTMATTEGGYNPISYHCGSVWPHDTSLTVAGLARYGYTQTAGLITDGLLAALSFYPDHRLPELFAGYSREEAPFPVEYPTANRPQAWASGAILLLTTAMAGLDAMTPGLRGQPFLPPSVESLRLEGAQTSAGSVSVELARSGTSVSRTLRRLDRWRWPWQGRAGERGA